MKKLIAIGCIFFIKTSAAQPVDTLKSIIDTSISKMQQYALHRKEVNWEIFKSRVYAQTKGISNLDSLLAQYPLFFKWLNDYHGAVATPTKWIKWKEGKLLKPINSMVDSALRTGPRLRVDRWGDIAYFRVPSVQGLADEIPKRTQRLFDTICKINPSTAKAWIIDLRLNTGGNVWPMLSCLAAIIGDGKIGGLKFIDGSPDEETFIKEGKPYGNNQFYSIPNITCPLPKTGTPVVVLTGPMTGSSGEVVLAAFKGRPNTIIIGEQTSGYVTSNSNFELRPNIYLFLATAFIKDRNDRHYTDGIEPDIRILDGDNFYDLEKDRKVQKAIEWLKNKIGD